MKVIVCSDSHGAYAAAEQLLEGKIGPGDRVAAAVCGDQVSLYRI